MISMLTRPRTRASVVLLLAAGLLLAGPTGEAQARRIGTDARTGKKLYNRERVGRSIHKLRWDRRLNRIAKRHSKRMARQNYLHHNDRLAYQARNIPWTILGENVGVGHTVRTLHGAFMNSKSHRHNILNSRFHRVGVGVVKARGRTWITFIFAG